MNNKIQEAVWACLYCQQLAKKGASCWNESTSMGDDGSIGTWQTSRCHNSFDVNSRISPGFWFITLPVPIGSMVLLYMVCHGSHQYTPNVSIYTSTMDPMGYSVQKRWCKTDRTLVQNWFSLRLFASSKSLSPHWRVPATPYAVRCLMRKTCRADLENDWWIMQIQTTRWMMVHTIYFRKCISVNPLNTVEPPIHELSLQK